MILIFSSFLMMNVKLQLVDFAPLRMAASLPQNKMGPEIVAYLQEAILDDNPCNAELRRGLNYFLGEDSIFTLLGKSGLAANELGDYRNCVKIGWKYFYMLIQFNGASILKNGVCLPSPCKTEHLGNIRKGIADAIRAIAKIPIFEKDIYLIDVKQMNEIHTKMEKEGYITIWLAFGMIILCVICTVIVILMKKDHQENVMYKISKCFDIFGNLKGILYGENAVDPNLNVLNGIRTIGMFWIVGGHCFQVFMGMIAPILNPLEAFKALTTERSYSYYVGGTLSVDIFFFLTAFLGVLVTDHQIKTSKSNKIITVLMLYLHRFVRLIPLYGLTILVSIYVITKLYEGPGYWTIDLSQGIQFCKDNWMYNLLFVSNFVNVDQNCLGWSWYLSNDFQMYMILPLLIILYNYNKIYGLLTVAAMFTVSCAIQIGLFIHYDISLRLLTDNLQHYADEYYIKPYCRINPFLLGIIFAWLYQSRKEQENQFFVFTSINKLIINNALIRYLMYAIGAFSIYCCIFLFFDFYKPDDNKNMFETVVFNILSRPCFVLALMLILYPAMLGKSPIIQGIFGNEFWGTMSKLTFAAYLFHPFVIIFWFASVEESIYFKGKKLVIAALECFVITYALALLLSLFIETPLTLLSKEFLRPSKAKREPIAGTTKKTEDKKEIIITKQADNQ